MVKSRLLLPSPEIHPGLIMGSVVSGKTYPLLKRPPNEAKKLAVTFLKKRKKLAAVFDR